MSGLEQKIREHNEALIYATFKKAFLESKIEIDKVLVGQYERDDPRRSDESYLVVISSLRGNGIDYHFGVDLSKRELTLSSASGLTQLKDPSLEAKIFAALELAARALGVKRLKAVDVIFGDVDARSGSAKYSSIDSQLTATRRIYWASRGFSLEPNEPNNLVGNPGVSSGCGYLVKPL